MRRIHVGVLLAALAALIVTSIAVADENKPSTSPAVSAHFTATGNVKTQGCAVNNKSTTKPPANDGTATTSIKLETRGQLAGTVTSSEKRLNGPVRINLRLLVNRNSGFGIATGTFRVAGKVDADLVGVVSGSNRVDGFLRGTAKDRRLLANFSATMAVPAAGATTASTLTGDIGTGSHSNTAVFGLGGC